MSMTKPKAKQVTTKLDASGSTIRSLHDKLSESVSVKDFGAVGDGVTDDSLAFTAAFTASDDVYVPEGVYNVTAGFTMYGRGKRLRGAGPSIAVLQTTSLTANVITQDTSESQVYGQVIEGLTIRCGTGPADFGTRTAGAHIRSLKYPRNCVYRDIELVNVYDGFSFNGAQYCYFTNIWVQQYGNNTADGLKARSAFRFENALDGVDESYCTDVHLSNVQVSGYKAPALPSGMQHAIYVNRMDGLYIVNSHFIECEYDIYCDGAPDTVSPAYTGRMASLQASNSYFDTCANSHVIFTGSLASNYKSVLFSNCTFRAARGSTGSVAINAAINTVEISNCNIRDNSYSGILTGAGGAAGLASNLIVSGTSLSGNNTVNSSSHGDIIWRGTGGAITGTSHVGGGVAGYAILLGSDGTGADLSNIGTTQSTATVGGTVTGGVVVQPSGVWIDGEIVASNANGVYRITKSGALECWHSLASSSSADTTWTYPYAFASGVTPIVHITSASLSGPAVAVANLSGAPTNTSCAFNIFNASNTRQVLTARVSARGKWK